MTAIILASGMQATYKTIIAGMLIGSDITGTTYTFVLADANTYMHTTNGSAVTITVPTNASVTYPVGTTLTIFQAGAGQVSFVAAGGVTINKAEGLKISAQYKSITLVKYATDTWDLIGALAA